MRGSCVVARSNTGSYEEVWQIDRTGCQERWAISKRAFSTLLLDCSYARNGSLLDLRATPDCSAYYCEFFKPFTSPPKQPLYNL